MRPGDVSVFKRFVYEWLSYIIMHYYYIIIIMLNSMHVFVLIFAVIAENRLPMLEHRAIAGRKMWHMTIRPQSIWNSSPFNGLCNNPMLVFVTPILILGIIINYYVTKMKDLIMSTEDFRWFSRFAIHGAVCASVMF